MLGIKARLRYRQPHQLQRKGPHAPQETPYLCHATCNGRTIAGPHPDPNEVERQAWEYLRVKVCRYHDATERAAMKTKREVSAVGGVRLIVRGPDGFPVEIVLLEGGLFEVE